MRSRSGSKTFQVRTPSNLPSAMKVCFWTASPNLSTLADTLAETVELTDSALAALSQASRHLDEAEQGFKHTDEPELKAQLDKLRSDHYYLRKLRASVESLSDFLSSRASDAVRRRAY